MTQNRPHNLNQLHAEALDRDDAETKAAHLQAAANVIRQAQASDEFWMDSAMRTELKAAEPGTRDHQVLTYATDAHGAHKHPLLHLRGNAYNDDLNREAATMAVQDLHQQAEQTLAAADQTAVAAAGQHRFAA